MRRALLIAQNDLVQRVRHGSAIIVAVGAPLAMAAVFSLLIGGASSSKFDIGVVDADHSATTRGLLEGLTAPRTPAERKAGDPITFTALGSEAVARHQVDKGDVDAALVIPSGFEAAATAGRPTQLLVLRSPSRLIGGQVAESVASGIAGNVGQVELAVRTAAASGVPVTPALTDAAAAAAPALSLGPFPRGGREASPGAFYGASMSIVFLFFTVGFAARSILAERRDGTLARIMATPTSPASVLFGKSLAVQVLAFGGFVTVWLSTTLLFGARWGRPLPVLVVIAATVLALGGVSTFVTALARTDRQADTYTSVVTFVLALLGGNFVGPGAAPAVLRRVSLFTPNGWALRAFTDLSADAASLGTVAGSVGVLLLIALVAGTIGMARMRLVVDQ